MTAERDTTRIVRSWLRTDEHESADRILETVLSRLDATPQRRRMWPALRDVRMNRFARVAFGAAAMILVAFVGLQLLPSAIPGPGAPSPSPAATATPRVDATPTPGPTTPGAPRVVPLAGALDPGRYPVTLEGVTFTMAFTDSGWRSNGVFGFDKGSVGPDGAGFIVWPHDADGVFSDPCQQIRAPKAGPTAADMAAAITTVPGLEVLSGPTALTLGGRPAQSVVVKLPDSLPCQPDQFYLWYDDEIPNDARFASQAGQVIRVWIIEVDGKRLQIDGETFVGAGPEIGAELDAIIASIQFE